MIFSDTIHTLIMKLRTLYYLPLHPFFIKCFGLLLIRQKNDEQPSVNNIKSVLMIKLDEIGDLILLTPFLRELRQNIPTASITIVVKPINYELLEFCPYIDNVLIYNIRFNKVFRVCQQYYRMVKICSTHLWRKKFDVCIIPRWDGDDLLSAPLAYLSGARTIVAYDQNDSSSRLINIKLKKKNQHEVMQNLDIINFLGGEVKDTKLEIWLDQSDVEFAAITLLNDYHKIIALAPGARSPSRRWHIDNFVALVNAISSEYIDYFKFIIIGSEQEADHAKYIADASKGQVVNMTGLPLRKTATLLKKCCLFIGNNSGLAHLSAAVNLPGIVIFSHPQNGDPAFYNSALRFKPWYEKTFVLQPKEPISPCGDGCVSRFGHCINQITVENVLVIFRQITSYLIA